MLACSAIQEAIWRDRIRRGVKSRAVLVDQKQLCAGTDIEFWSKPGQKDLPGWRGNAVG